MGIGAGVNVGVSEGAGKGVSEGVDVGVGVLEMVIVAVVSTIELLVASLMNFEPSYTQPDRKMYSKINRGKTGYLPGNFTWRFCN